MLGKLVSHTIEASPRNCLARPGWLPPGYAVAVVCTGQMLHLPFTQSLHEKPPQTTTSNASNMCVQVSLADRQITWQYQATSDMRGTGGTSTKTGDVQHALAVSSFEPSAFALLAVQLSC